MTLHSTDNFHRVNECLARCSSRDALLLLGDAVRWAASDAAHPAAMVVYALSDDLAARALSVRKDVAIVDYAGWVKLSEQHPQHVHWR